MIVIPAIDLKGGRCVRLIQGDKDQETVFSDDPVAVAKGFEAAGAERIHVVDLDGAFDGKPKNSDILKRIVRVVDVPVQTGGGIRSLDAVQDLLDAGVDRVILGTIALKSPETVAEACARFGGERVMVGIDARDGRVAVEGWVEESDVDAFDLAVKMKAMGIREIVYTDIARDGMLLGPNFQSTERMLETGVGIIASGGVSSAQDLTTLAKHSSRGLVGAIVGKAIYTGRIDLAEAIRLVKEAAA